MGDKPIPLGEHNGSTIWAYFEYGKGYTALSCTSHIGPLTTKERAKRAICDLVDAEIKYLNVSNSEAITDQPRQAFKESPEYKQVFDKYKLPMPKNE